MSIESRYTPHNVEEKWYKHWKNKNYFRSVPDEREPYSIVIPPPNVTGVLHMGHMLDNTIQDVLARKARQEGFNVCWVPGLDHASIATEAKVVKMLREKGIKKSDLTREEYLNYAWEWKEKYGGIILSQLEKLGASCDWERTAFTMDDERSKSVLKAFVDLYNEGKLYRGKRMVNWDPRAQTVLSNEEVIYKEEKASLYYVKYQVVDSDESLIIATTRPETIMGDTGVAVHPEDPRYTHLKGKSIIVPLVDREVPIIFDDYVDREFGTGALKITPAHDVNDYEIGLRHDLEIIDILNDDGSLNSSAQIHIGTKATVARDLVAQDLEERGLIVKIEDLIHNVGRSERTNAVVEPKLSLQWYVDMKSLSEPALDAVEKDIVEFFPKNQKNTFRHWMNNIRDWCISRQLWWGHRIPAWYYKDEVFVAERAEDALTQVQKKYNDPTLSLDHLTQDEDVLDTWFSSWLWPITVFNGFSSKEELDYYYPTSVLVTGWDIIFLWVARMIMAGYQWEGKRPFKHVYFHGMVRDKQRRKMSKSLGNSPDALGLIEKFGADGVRFGMLMSSPAGGDLLFDEKLCEQGRNFCNKIWNALRLIKGWELNDSPISQKDDLALDWIRNKFQDLVNTNEKSFKEYRLSEVLMNTYNFVWNDFCSWFLELVKPPYGEASSKELNHEIIDVFENICIILHPFMPFITEEIWHLLKERGEGNDCIASTYPTSNDSVDIKVISAFDLAKEVVTNVRDIRNKEGLKMSQKLPLTVIESEEINTYLGINGYSDLLCKLGNLSSFAKVKEKPSGIGFISGKENFVIVIESNIDVDKLIAETKSELEYQYGFVNSIEKKLSNERFVNNAPSAVVGKERKKLKDGKDRIKILESKLKELKE
jgi:valyl-tRNA synthetase